MYEKNRNNSGIWRANRPGRCFSFALFWIVFLISPSAKSDVLLPVEVMGAPPYTVPVELDIPAGKSGAAVKLRVRVHNVSYRNKGQIRVNGSSWYDLWNDEAAIKVAEPDKSYGGFGGGFHTITFTVGIPYVSFVDGTNMIRFRYVEKHEDHPTAGYRVVDLDILDGDDRSVLPAGFSAFDDPATWTAPLGATGINNGRNRWKSEGCGDCHTADGFDLKYFNISNKTIIEQCKKSGFTERQGEEVASYIRSLDYDVVPQARPWNPPYQPGPSLRSRSPYEWAAGAGLDAVLKSDKEMVKELFNRDNPSEQDVMNVINNYDTIPDVQYQRVAVQFPDWISWIPRKRPSEFLSSFPGKLGLLEGAYADFKGALAGKSLNDLNQAISPSADAYKDQYEFYNNNELFKLFGVFATKVHQVLDDDFREDWPYSPSWATRPSTGNKGDLSYVDLFEADKRRLSAWYAMKLFEAIHHNKLYDISSYRGFPTADQPRLQWPSREWAVFQNAAHIISDDRTWSFFVDDTNRRMKTKSIYLSSVWYQVQLVLTPGNRTGGDVIPNDYAYNLNHVHKLGYWTGIYEPARMMQNYWLAASQRNNGILPKDSHESQDVDPWMLSFPVSGCNMREFSPYRIYGRATTDFMMLDPDSIDDVWELDRTVTELNNYHPGLQGRVQSAFYRATANVLNRFNYSQSGGDFERITMAVSTGGFRTDFQLENRNATPEYGGDLLHAFHHGRYDTTGVTDAVEIHAAYTLVRLMHQENIVSQEAFSAIKSWVDKAWNTDSWTDWPTDYVGPDEVNNDPVIESGATATPTTITVDETTQLSVVAGDPDGDTLTYTWNKVSGSGTVTFSPNGGGTSDNTVAAFSAAGNYELEVTVSDGNGGSPTSSVGVTVNSAEVNTPATVNITSHADGMTYDISEDVFVTDPKDNSGIERVWLRVNGTWAKPSVTSSPWSFDLSELPDPIALVPGTTNEIMARAIANDGDTVNFTINIEVTNGGGNNAPEIVSEATASPSTLAVGGTTELSVVATDADGDTLTYDWDKLSGPGTVSFTSPAASVTDASFTAAGAYTLKVTVSDGVVPVSSEFSVTVTGGADELAVWFVLPADIDNVPADEDVLVEVGTTEGIALNRVYLQLDGQVPWLGHDDTAPYQWNLGTLSLGGHTLKARAFPKDDETYGRFVDHLIEITVVAGGGGTFTELFYEGFESGFGLFVDGGDDCKLGTDPTYASAGTNSLNLQDNSGPISAAALASSFDASAYSQLKVDFDYAAVSMETGEDFMVEYWNGSNWVVAQAFVRGVDFNNGEAKSATVTIDGPFSTDCSIRFRCDASGNADDIYIDEIHISAK